MNKSASLSIVLILVSCGLLFAGPEGIDFTGEWDVTVVLDGVEYAPLTFLFSANKFDSQYLGVSSSRGFKEIITISSNPASGVDSPLGRWHFTEEYHPVHGYLIPRVIQDAHVSEDGNTISATAVAEESFRDWIAPYDIIMTRRIEIKIPWIARASSDGFGLHTVPEGDVAYLTVPEEYWEQITSMGLARQEDAVKLIRPLYRMIEGEYDFLFFVLDLDQKPADTFDGRYFVINRTAEGTGLPFIDNREWAGAADTSLKGALTLSFRDGLRDGPVLHEILHHWSSGYDDIFKPENFAHWGFSSINGQLGGFDETSLELLAPGLYRTQPFYDFFNPVPYAPLELYTMGLIGAEEVPDIILGRNGRFTTRESTYVEFKVDSLEKISIETIIESYGQRRPFPGDAARSFAVLPILIGPVLPEWVDSEFVAASRALTYAGDDDNEYRLNFWEATGGRARLELRALRPR